MKRKFKNKAITKFEDKRIKRRKVKKVVAEEEQDFFFPLEQKTVRAKNYKEALRKL